MAVGVLDPVLHLLVRRLPLLAAGLRGAAALELGAVGRVGQQRREAGQRVVRGANSVEQRGEIGETGETGEATSTVIP